MIHISQMLYTNDIKLYSTELAVEYYFVNNHSLHKTPDGDSLLEMKHVGFLIYFKYKVNLCALDGQ